MNIASFSSRSCLSKVFSVGVLSFIFALALVFSPIGARAQDKAADVDPTSESEVKAFLSRIVAHYKSEIGSNPQEVRINLAEITRDLRTDPMYQSSKNNMYTILIEDHFGVVFNHIAYPELYGYKFDKNLMDDGNDVVTPSEAVKHLIADSSVDGIVCKEYTHDGKKRWACGAKVQALASMTLLAGLHHDKEEKAFSGPACSSFEAPEFTAGKLYENPTDPNLKSYVQSFIKSAQKAVLSEIKNLLAEDTELFTTPDRAGELRGKVHALINSLATCVQDDRLKHENIYAFIMSTNKKGTVLANGNNLNLNGLNFDLEDEKLEGEDKKVVNLIRTKLLENACGDTTSEIGDGNCAYITYRWDDPATKDDDVENWLANNEVPGTSTKKGYVEVAFISADVTEEYPNIRLENAPVIFGSGFYPATNMQDGDDGACAIAGTEHTSRNALANLFLMAFVLLSVVFLRRT